jgi:hypothetical protein
MTRKKPSECSQFHRKYWTGKLGYFWVNDKCTLYCHCPKCDRCFEMAVNKKEFTWGDEYYKSVRIEYGV